MPRHHQCLCPFYECHSRKGRAQATRTCENVMKNDGFGVKNQLLFASYLDEKAYYEIFCMDTYQKCEYYKFIKRVKYGE